MQIFPDLFCHSQASWKAGLPSLSPLPPLFVLNLQRHGWRLSPTFLGKVKNYPPLQHSMDNFSTGALCGVYIDSSGNSTCLVYKTLVSPGSLLTSLTLKAFSSTAHLLKQEDSSIFGQILSSLCRPSLGNLKQIFISNHCLQPDLWFSSGATAQGHKYTQQTLEKRTKTLE